MSVLDLSEEEIAIVAQCLRAAVWSSYIRVDSGAVSAVLEKVIVQR